MAAPPGSWLAGVVDETGRDGESTRARLLAAIGARPGSNKKELAQALGIGWNTVRHHVRILERRRQVVVETRGWDHEVYLALVPPEHRAWLRALNDPGSGGIIRTLGAHGDSRLGALSASVGLSPKVVRRSLLRLLADGLVERVPAPGRPRYRSRGPPPELGLPRHGSTLPEPQGQAFEPLLAGQ